ncbi:MAG: hypothetical protein ACYC7D_12965 [Nitrososphaerales archaeon]
MQLADAKDTYWLATSFALNTHAHLIAMFLCESGAGRRPPARNSIRVIVIG